MIKSDKIYTLIKDTIQGPTTWQAIVDAVNANNLQPTHPHNWLSVRGVLRGLIDQGEIRRTGDVWHEIYVPVESC